MSSVFTIAGNFGNRQPANEMMMSYHNPVYKPSAIRSQFQRYFIASGVAFIVDFSVLIFLAQVFNINYLWAAAFGFMLGLITIYLLSVTWVFGPSSAGHFIGFTIFFIIGILGLGLNEVLLYILIEFVHLNLVIAKICTTGGVFMFNFIARRKLVFN